MQMIVIPLNTFWISLFILEVIFNRENENYWIICENERIHKSKLIAKFLASYNIWMIIISIYCSSLNTAEKLILSIRKIINKEIDSGK